MKQPAPPELVRALLDAAGIPGDATVVEVPSPGRVNTTTIIEVAGDRYAVRAYGWPFGGTPPYDRRSKEAVLHPRLRAAGLAVPAVLAAATVDGTDAALLEFVPGELLGVVAQRVPAAALAEAWGEAGAALARLHAVAAGPTAGFVTADGVQPFAEGSYGAWIAAGLDEPGRGIGLDPALLGRVVDALVPILDRRPIRLGHSDANPWNVLVAEGPDGWRLSAWLDWEFAWAADPSFDLMRATVQRYAPIGPAPPSFWEGYGGAAHEVGLAAASLHYAVGMHADHASGGRTPEVTQAVAHGPDPHVALKDLAALVL